VQIHLPQAQTLKVKKIGLIFGITSPLQALQAASVG
jgi:hypothetical protein